jgi:hypothetical protein
MNKTFAEIDIIDGKGKLPEKYLRAQFESAFQTTKRLAERTRFERARDGHYVDPATQAAWIGFAIGMRCYERLVKSGNL